MNQTLAIPQVIVAEFCRQNHIRMRTAAELSRYFRREVLASAQVVYAAR